MASPSATLSTLRPEIAGSLLEFSTAADRVGYIGHRVLPVFEVPKQTGIFGKITVEELLQNRDTHRAPGSGYNRGSFQFTSDSYLCEEHGAEEAVDRRQAEMYSDFFDAEMIHAERAMAAVMRNAEKRIAAAVFNTSTWTATNVTNEWDDATNAVPLTDVEARVQAIWDASGLWPNALIINRKVFRNLRNCDQIKDRIAASGAGFPNRASDITTAQMAELFDLEHILVGGGADNTANEGATVSIGPIWSDENAMVARISVSTDIQEPCLGRTFHWSEDGSQIEGLVESYPEEQTRSEILRVRHDVDEKILYVEAAELLGNITT